MLKKWLTVCHFNKHPFSYLILSHNTNTVDVCFFNFYSSSSECLDSTLNVLARALENNKENPEIWCHYLRLFSKRGTKEEIQEMCETAVEYAPSYQIWWTVSKKKSFM